jgi:CcmD family protein
MGGSEWVTAVNLILWTGIFLYIWRLSRRLEEIERDR